MISPVERKNSWQLAEAVGDKTPDASQRLLYSTKWDADAVRDELQYFVIDQFGDSNGIGVVGESGFLKKGEKATGVQRPQVAVPAWSGMGRKPVKERVVDESAEPVSIPALVASWPEGRWHRLDVAAGEKGPRVYDWAYQRIVENQDQLPGRDAWLLVRRSLASCLVFVATDQTASGPPKPPSPSR